MSGLAGVPFVDPVVGDRVLVASYWQRGKNSIRDGGETGTVVEVFNDVARVKLDGGSGVAFTVGSPATSAVTILARPTVPQYAFTRSDGGMIRVSSRDYGRVAMAHPNSSEGVPAYTRKDAAEMIKAWRWVWERWDDLRDRA